MPGRSRRFDPAGRRLSANAGRCSQENSTLTPVLAGPVSGVTALAMSRAPAAKSKPAISESTFYSAYRSIRVTWLPIAWCGASLRDRSLRPSPAGSAHLWRAESSSAPYGGVGAASHFPKRVSGIFSDRYRDWVESRTSRFSAVRAPVRPPRAMLSLTPFSVRHRFRFRLRSASSD